MGAVGEKKPLSIMEFAILAIVYDARKTGDAVVITDDMLNDEHKIAGVRSLLERKYITLSQPLKRRLTPFAPKPEVWLRKEGEEEYETLLKKIRETQIPPNPRSKKIGKVSVRHK